MIIMTFTPKDIIIDKLLQLADFTNGKNLTIKYTNIQRIYLFYHHLLKHLTLLQWKDIYVYKSHSEVLHNDNFRPDLYHCVLGVRKPYHL